MARRESRYSDQWIRASYVAFEGFLSEIGLDSFEFVGDKELVADNVRLDQWSQGWRVCYDTESDDTLVFVALENTEAEHVLFEFFKSASEIRDIFAFRRGNVRIIGVTDLRLPELENWVRPLPGLSVLQLSAEYILRPETDRYLKATSDTAEVKLGEERAAESAAFAAQPISRAYQERVRQTPQPLKGWFRLVCYSCHLPIELRSNLILAHRDQNGRECLASGRPGKAPTPYKRSVAYTCEICGAETGSSAQTGSIHSHKTPGTEEFCTASGSYTLPKYVDAEITPISKEEYQKLLAKRARSAQNRANNETSRITADSPNTRNVYPSDRPSSSVFAYNGGSPGAGRKS